MASFPSSLRPSAASSPSPYIHQRASSSSSVPLPNPSNIDIESVIEKAISKAPSPARDTRTQLFVGNLPYRVRWQDLKDLFRKSGTVLRADVSLGPDNRSRGYGTVLLASSEDASRAIEMYNGYTWQSRVLEVRPDRLPPDLDLSLPFQSQPQPLTFLIPQSHTPIPFILSHSQIPTTAASTSFFTDHQRQYSDFGGSNTSANARPQTAESTSSAAIPPPPSLTHHSSSSTSRISASGELGSTPGKNLFVGNLPFHCQWQDLKDLFRLAGTIVRADVSLGPDGRSRGYGTVLFADERDAEKAVLMFNGIEYNGRTLKVHHDKFTSQTPTSPPVSPRPPSSVPTAPSPFLQQRHSSPKPHHNHHNPQYHIPIPPPLFQFQSQPSSPFGHPFAPGQTSPLHHMFAHQSSLSHPQFAMPPPPHPSSPHHPQFPPHPPPPPAQRHPLHGTTEGASSLLPAFASINLASPPLPPVSTLPPHTSVSAATTNSHTTPNKRIILPPGSISLPPPQPLSPSSPTHALMTPSMPGFTFHPGQIPTPPLAPHFLSPGLGPFSPILSYSPQSHQPPQTSYNPFLNPAPGAPIHIFPVGNHQHQAFFGLGTPTGPPPQQRPDFWLPQRQQEQQEMFNNSEGAMLEPNEYFPPIEELGLGLAGGRGGGSRLNARVEISRSGSAGSQTESSSAPPSNPNSAPTVSTSTATSLSGEEKPTRARSTSPKGSPMGYPFGRPISKSVAASVSDDETADVGSASTLGGGLGGGLFLVPPPANGADGVRRASVGDVAGRERRSPI